MELVLVMALMAIVIGFALPRFHRMTDDNPTRDIAQWIKFNALALREKSQTEQVSWALRIDFNSGEIGAVREKPLADETALPGQDLPEQDQAEPPPR